MSASSNKPVAMGSGQMFDKIARRYDLLNRILSFGFDKSWRKKAIAYADLKEGEIALDVATGTADFALAISKAYPSAKIIGLDPSAEMLAVGKNKIQEKQLESQISLVEGNAYELPFKEDEITVVTMAFGIRNVPDRLRALREIHRVLKDKGRLIILELNEPSEGFTAPFAKLYLHHLVPKIGALISGAKEYKYLQKSIEGFPPYREFAKTISENGFEIIELRTFTFGACALYVAQANKTNLE